MGLSSGAFADGFDERDDAKRFCRVFPLEKAGFVRTEPGSGRRVKEALFSTQYFYF